MTLRQLLRKPFVSSAHARPVDLMGKHMIVTGCGPGPLGFETALRRRQAVVTTLYTAGWRKAASIAIVVTPLTVFGVKLSRGLPQTLGEVINLPFDR